MVDIADKVRDRLKNRDGKRAPLPVKGQSRTSGKGKNPFGLSQNVSLGNPLTTRPRIQVFPLRPGVNRLEEHFDKTSEKDKGVCLLSK